jgi:hypothetical protein
LVGKVFCEEIHGRRAVDGRINEKLFTKEFECITIKTEYLESNQS